MGAFLSSSINTKEETVNRIEDVIANTPVETAPIESVLVESASDPVPQESVLVQTTPVLIVNIPPVSYCPPPDCPCPPPDCPCPCTSPNAFDMDISGSSSEIREDAVVIPTAEVIQSTVVVSVPITEPPASVSVVHTTTEHFQEE